MYGIDVSFNGTATVDRSELSQNGISSEDPFSLDIAHPEYPLFMVIEDGASISIHGILRYVDSDTAWFS